MIYITGLTREELRNDFKASNLEPFRADQILNGLYKRNIMSVAQVKNIPSSLEEKINQRYMLVQTRVKMTLLSNDGTAKLAIELEDKEIIETVLIPEKERNTICISTQVGCPVGCVFCASGLFGLSRNLKVHEIIEQIIHVQRSFPHKKITNIVLMGIGEPLLNYNNVVKALKIMHSEWGLGFGYHKITLSTAGIADKIYKLVQDKVTPNLAISLHASNDKLRKELVPNIKWTMDDLIKAARDYKKATKKSVTFQYVMLDSINTDEVFAKELQDKLKNAQIKLNLIPYNKVTGLGYENPSDSTVERFAQYFKIATVRKPRGTDIDSACGQLRINTRSVNFSSGSPCNRSKRI